MIYSRKGNTLLFKYTELLKKEEWTWCTESKNLSLQRK